MEAEILVSARQVAALLTWRLGRKVTVRQIENVVLTLVEVGHLPDRHGPGGEREFTSEDVDLLTGEFVRRRAPWTRRALVDRGFRAWVIGGEMGEGRVCLLPWWTDKGVWGAVTVGKRPETVEAVEWPTGRVTAVLVAVGSRGDDLPVYEWRAVAAESASAGGGVLVDAASIGDG